VLVLISLAVVGAMFAMQNKSQGPISAAVTQAESQAIAAAASTSFAQVDQVLQADYAQAGTYVGAPLPVGSGVTLAQASVRLGVSRRLSLLRLPADASEPRTPASRHAQSSMIRLAPLLSPHAS
jgi:hypothetical protein